MAYRNEVHALTLQVAELERENTDLKNEVETLRGQARRRRDEDREQRREGALRNCAVCEGSLLPVAVFAGRDLRSPIPLSLSTMRFGDPDGGFTRSAPIKSLVCSSCGFIHNFIDIRTPEGVEVTEEIPLADPDEL